MNQDQVFYDKERGDYGDTSLGGTPSLGPVFGPMRPSAAYAALTRLEMAGDKATDEMRCDAAQYPEYADAATAMARMQ